MERSGTGKEVNFEHRGKVVIDLRQVTLQVVYDMGR